MAARAARSNRGTALAEEDLRSLFLPRGVPGAAPPASRPAGGAVPAHPRLPIASHSRALACANVHPVRSWGDTAARPRPQGKRRNPSLADELVAVKLDRLGRSTRDVYNPVWNLGAKGAAFTALEPSFLTKDATGRSL